MLMLFTICAVAGVVVMAAQLGMMFFGLDHDGSDIGDVGDDLDMGDDYVDGHPDGTAFFNVLSFRSIVASVAFFGLVGRAVLAAEYAPWVALVSALGSGFVAMVAVAWLMRAESGELE